MKNKKIIHALTIVDKSGSMLGLRSRTVEGVNSSINALKSEVDEDTEIIATQLQFSSIGNNWFKNNSSGAEVAEDSGNFVFKYVGKQVQNISDLTEADYFPGGGTPLIDAIGYGIEKIKAFHGDKLGDDNLKIIVTIFTDGEENTSSKWTNDEIKKMIDHFQSDDKWTFTFVGCGSFENVSGVSKTFGISSANTVNYATANDDGIATAYAAVSTSYSNFSRSVKLGMKSRDLFDKEVKK